MSKKILFALACVVAGSHAARAADCSVHPVMSTHTLPPFPKESVQAGEEGKILLAVTIAADGAVSGAQVLDSSGYSRLDMAAEEFVKKNWRWEAVDKECSDRQMRVNVVMDLRDARVQAGLRVVDVLLTKTDFPDHPAKPNEHGATLLAVSLGGKGGLAKVFPIESSGFPDLDAKAQELAMLKYTYAPGSLNGEPVNTILYLNMIWPDLSDAH